MLGRQPLSDGQGKTDVHLKSLRYAGREKGISNDAYERNYTLKDVGKGRVRWVDSVASDWFVGSPPACSYVHIWNVEVIKSDDASGLFSIDDER
jgi:hypothetical protein